MTPTQLQSLLENNQIPTVAILELLKFALHVYILNDREFVANMKSFSEHLSLMVLGYLGQEGDSESNAESLFFLSHKGLTHEKRVLLDIQNVSV